LIFPSKTWFFGIYLNFQGQKSFLNQYLPHSESKSYKIKFIKSCSPRYFQKNQDHIPIPPKFSATIQFNFQWRNHSIFNNFCTASLNAMKLSWCTPPSQELSKETKNVIWNIPVQWISSVQNKTNYFVSYINVLKTFVTTLCYNNDESVIFLSCKMFFHWKCKWIMCCFYHFT
jgi:hypothetical protein